MDGSSISGGRSTEGEQAANSVNGGHMDSAGQATSLSSLEEVAPGLAKRTRRKLTFDRQCSDSSTWTTGGGEDGGSERVRFDDHVSVIEADQERVIGGKLEGCAMNNRSAAGRKRNKDSEPETDAEKTSKYESRKEFKLVISKTSQNNRNNVILFFFSFSFLEVQMGNQTSRALWTMLRASASTSPI